MRATAVHPGGIKTELSRYMDAETTQRAIDRINSVMTANGGVPFQYKSILKGRRHLRLGRRRRAR